MIQTVTPIFVNWDARSAESRSVENPSVPLSAVGDDASDLGDAWFGGRRNPSGVRVNRVRALGYSAVWRAVNLIANKVAALPFNVYSSAPGATGRKIDREHPAHALLRKRPNEYMTPVVFKRTLISHVLLRGNGYAYIFRDSDARPVELLTLNPETTSPFRRNGELWYATQVPDGQGMQTETRRLPACDVFHVAGLGFDGLVGYDVVRILSDTIGKAIAAREYGARYFSQDASARVALEFPIGMKENLVQGVIDRWRTMTQGLENKHKAAMLREGVKLNTYSATARDAQLTENYTFDARDIANVFGLPPHKVGDDSNSSYNSLEQENQALLDDTIDPWLVTIEEQADEKLLTEEEKRNETHYCKFVRQALARANLNDRGNYYVKAIANGWMSPDEVRDLEDENPIPDGAGQQFFRPLNSTPLLVEEPSPTPPAAAGANSDAESDSVRQKFAGGLRKAIAKSASRMARRVATQAERAKKDLAAWSGIPLESNFEAIADEFGPLIEACRALNPAVSSAKEVARGVLQRCRAHLPPSAAGLAAWAAEFEAAIAADLPIFLLPERP